ncbi:hypothetical protein VNO77_23039 [Canavalia gladiata]|uniref:Uncharacterized protein n=1 Tax=Canavalia gladiata TaxID=3824 RepID=A0AAN9L4A5_CANGL
MHRFPFGRPYPRDLKESQENRAPPPTNSRSVHDARLKKPLSRILYNKDSDLQQQGYGIHKQPVRPRGLLGGVHQFGVGADRGLHRKQRRPHVRAWLELRSFLNKLVSNRA